MQKNNIQFGRARDTQILRVGRVDEPLNDFLLTHQLAFDMAIRH